MEAHRDKLSVDFSVLLQHTVTGGTSNVDVDSDLTPIYGKYDQLRHGKENWDLANVHYALRTNYDFGWSSLTSITSYYNPAWDAQLFSWTDQAINAGYRGQVREEFQILTFVQDGLITGPAGAPFGSSGFSINCPIVQRLD